MFSTIINKLKNMNPAIKASFWFVICGFMQKGISMLTTPIFTRLLDNEQYGIYSIFTSWLEILTVIVTLRLYNGIYMKGLVKYDKDRDRFTSSLLGLTTFLVTIYFIVYLVFKNQINNLLGLSTSMMACMFLLMITESWFWFWSTRKRVDFKYKALVIVTILISLLKPIAGIIAVISVESDKALFRIISIVIVEFFVYIWLYISQIRKCHVFFDKKYWIEAIKFNIVLIPHYLSQKILTHSDRIMISKYIGNSEAGIYSLAYSISNIMNLFNTAFLNSINPWNYKKLKEKKYSEIGKLSNLSLIIIMLVNLLLILAAPEILIIFAPPSYHEALYAIPPVTMSVYFTFLYGLFSSVEMYYDKNNYIMIASLIAATINIVLNSICIPKFGYIAAAYTTLISYIIDCIIHGMFVKRIKKINNIEEQIFNYKLIAFVSIIFLVIGLCLVLTYNNFIIRYSFVIIILIFAVIRRDRIQELLNKIKK